MNLFLILAFLFSVGATAGWVLEVFYRRFFSSANPERKWINPGFCTGPYVPLYGFGLCLLYLIASMETVFPNIHKAVLFLMMAVSMTTIEYVAGVWLLKRMNIRLWDYSDEWGNIQGLICPKFSVYWSILGAAYYFLIHPHVLDALQWLSCNLAFSFVIGLFFGVFMVDVGHSTQIITKLRAYAVENDVIVRYEAVKLQIRQHHEAARSKYHFFRPFHSDKPLREHLKEMHEHLEIRKK
ncbi:MAG: putative ABC transporter permease [Oscillospiraceae bacterium]|nr:putative ABC transporter permease [Oscillospiraceae bacterium]